jgi:hypothetical protein
MVSLVVEKSMDKVTVTKLIKSINRMREKVINAKGETIKGLSSIQTKKEKAISEKSRGANS